MQARLWRRAAAGLALVLVASLSGCRSPSPPGDRGSGEKRYPVAGKVVSVELPRSRVVLAHEEIPGFMDAMTMPFAVRDRALLNGLDAGDEVKATLVLSTSDHRSWLEAIEVVRKAEGAAAPPPAASEAKAGDPVPDASLLDQDGRTIRIADHRGKALALTFIYVRCPLPEFCPRVTASFAKIETTLAADEPLYARTRLLSISFDTENDTPDALKAYGRPFQPPGRPPFGHWALASGDKDEVRKIAGFFGLQYDEEQGQFNHNLRTAVVSPDGRVFRLWRGGDFTPDDVVKALREALAVPR